MVADAARSVDTNVKLILMVRVVCSTAVVVSGVAVGGQWKARQEGLSCGIERYVDDIPGKLLPHILSIDDGRCGGIVNMRNTAEDAIAFIDRRDRRGQGAADELLDPLVVAKKEEAIVKDRRTERSAVEIAAILRLPPRRREVVASVEIFVA